MALPTILCTSTSYNTNTSQRLGEKNIFMDNPKQHQQDTYQRQKKTPSFIRQKADNSLQKTTFFSSNIKTNVIMRESASYEHTSVWIFSGT